MKRVRKIAPKTAAVTIAAASSGRKSSPTCVGSRCSSAVSDSDISPMAPALAARATRIPTTGKVVASCSTGISGFRFRYWWTIIATTSARPPKRVARASTVACFWISSWAAPKKAATQPATDSVIAVQSHGASGSCGSASSNVSSERTHAATPIPATTQNSVRQSFLPASKLPIMVLRQPRRRCRDS